MITNNFEIINARTIDKFLLFEDKNNTQIQYSHELFFFILKKNNISICQENACQSDFKLIYTFLETQYI